MWKSSSTKVSSNIWVASRRFQRCLVSQGRLAQQQATSAGSTPPQPPVKPPPTEVPTPPPPPKKGGVFGKLLAVTVLGGAGVVGYAWYDEKFRNSMSDMVPYSRTALDAVFQYLPDSPTVPAILSRDPTGAGDSHRMPPPPLPLPPLPDTQNSGVDVKSAPPSPQPYVEEKSQRVINQEKRALERREAERLDVEERRQREAKEVEDRKIRDVDEARRRKQEREDVLAKENTDLEVSLEMLVTSCERRVEAAITGQDEIIQATQHHTSLLRTAMDDNDKILEKDDQWQSVSMAMDSRQEAVNAAGQAITDAKAHLEMLRHAIDEGRVNASTKKNKSLTKTKEVLNRLSTEFNKKSTQVATVESEARVLLDCKSRIDEARAQFAKELESITPDVRIGSKRGKMTEEDLNLLLAHAHRRVSQLQQQLAKQVTLEQLRLQDALGVQQSEDNQLTEQKLSQERDRLYDDFALQHQKMEAEVQVEFESDLRRQLARQAAAHSDHIQDVLRVREHELDNAYEKRLLDRLVQERAKFSLEISGWVARLKGIEAAVDARAEVEKMRLQEQQMWVACVALNNAISAGGDGATWDAQLLPLSDKVTAVQEASIRHPFVDVVVDSIPSEVLKRGVYTERNLRERFLRVNKVARRVAWLDGTTGSLTQYLASYVKSIVRYPFTYRLTRSVDEELDINVDGAVSDNFELLVTARYWLDKGDMEQVVRLMNQLQGESRRVAADWVHEARLHLEARQAAHILLAFAAASGLGSIS